METFKIKEGIGDLPYSIIWISLDGRLAVESRRTFKEAKEYYKRLKNLGRQPTVLINITEDIKESLTGETDEIKEVMREMS